MMTESERAAVLDRLAGRLRDFDDDTLRELDRLTDPDVLTSNPRPAPEAGLTRRQLITGLATGGAAVVLAAAGTAAVVGGDEEAAAVRDELERAQRVLDLHEELEATGLDETLERSMTAFGSSVTRAQRLGRALESGAVTLGGSLAEELAILEQTWQVQMVAPLEVLLVARAALRDRIAAARM
jgi:hypothetical protein